MSDLDLDDSIRNIQAASGRSLSLIKAFDTISNSAWLVSFGDEDGVLRRHTLSFGSPVTDHARELQIHRLAADAGLSPEVLYADTSAGLLITRYEPAGAFKSEDILSDDALQRVAVALAALHRIVVPASLTGYSLTEAAQCYWRRAGSPTNADICGLLQTVEDNELMVTASAVLCHRDLLHSNILNTQSVQFIDWEFASPGESWFDLAALISWHELDADQIKVFTEAYAQRALDVDELAALDRAIVSFRALCTLWSLPAVT